MAMHLLALVALIPITVQPVPSLAEGVAALNAGRAEDAVTLLERAAVAEPRSRLALLHLANAQRAARRYAAAATTLRELLRLDPGDKLALWNLVLVEADPALTTLHKLIALDPGYPNVFTALATMRTMQARDAYRAGKRAADVRIEDGEWIADAAPRATVTRHAAAPLDEAQAACEQARARDAAAPEPLVLLSLTLRMKSEIAADAQTAMRLVAEADALRQQAATLRQQQGPRPAPPLLDATIEPPPFPAPGPPPPPPPR
jgi:tetratricopeptide (TPR) repeat protein